MTSVIFDYRHRRSRNPWKTSIWTLLITFLALILVLATSRSFLTRQRDPKGCSMSWMRPAFAHFPDFDAEHTRLAKRYSLYLYREGMIDEDTRVKGVPVLFIPGNAGSYKQVRPLAAQAAVHYRDYIPKNRQTRAAGKVPLDFFAVEFNEDFSALHGQTLLDQAEYVNDAIAYILALYTNPHRSNRDASFPEPASVILVGHSMGGIVARTAMTLANYQAESINTIITLATPHARPPISFDEDILNIYKRINNYWRRAYSHRLDSKNALWETTVISIAGGSLDTLVPSDFSTLASLVPPSHGFTVFTSSIPEVWTSMDHLAITWCNQLREVVVASIYDVIDARDESQTVSRAARMKAFRKNYLTGLETSLEGNVPSVDVPSLLNIGVESSRYLQAGERLILRNFGSKTSGHGMAYLMPIPTQEADDMNVFRLLTSLQKKRGQNSEKSNVFLCNVLSQQDSESEDNWNFTIDLAADEDGSSIFSCVDAMTDAVLLPSSYSWNHLPVDNYLAEEWNTLAQHSPPFSYIQYEREALTDFKYVAIIDTSQESSHGWLIAEFAHRNDHSSQTMASSTSYLEASFPAKSILNEIRIPSIYSSLLTFQTKISKEPCSNNDPLFTPIVRQHMSQPYESKFFVNVHEANLSIHGMAPYIPIPLESKASNRGILLQIWADPSCNNPLNVAVKIDYFGSLGKLWMRYRTVFAVFPVLIVALALRKQFALYNETGCFSTFSEGLDLSLRRSIPITLAGLTVVGLFLSRISGFGTKLVRLGYAPEAYTDFTSNELLLGLQDPFFWFLVPLFGIISVGVCFALNYAVLSLTLLCAVATSGVSKLTRKSTSSIPKSTSVDRTLRTRLIILAILLFFVSTVIPYQFLYLMLCIVQMVTCVKVLRQLREKTSDQGVHFYNYAHSILIFMIWILPINGPTLIVLMHNLKTYGLTPFTSHHSIFSITPFIILVEIIRGGNLIPPCSSPIKQITSLLFLLFGVHTAIMGVSYAYRLHDIANIICIWIVAIHLSPKKSKVTGFKSFFLELRDGNPLSQQHEKKQRDIH